VLFRHYQQDRMGALVRLAMAETRSELPFHAGEARLLKGGLYLAWGLRDEAAGIFEALLATGAPPAQRDQAWYWLARIRHERGEHDRALHALRRIDGRLPQVMDADRVDLEGRVLLALGRNPEAVQLLGASRQPGAWRAFADFNRAVALARSGQAEAALPLLDALGRGHDDDAELATLRDRANLALGLARLEAGDADGARAALDRVRLESPYAARALLAAGWAEAQRGQFRAALGPWSTLADLQDVDGAALEAMLAVPWAWHQVDEPGESVLGYQRAAAACEADLRRLAAAANAARGGELLAFVLAERAEPEGEGMPVDGPLPAYLHALAVDHPFRAVAADLRDLQALRENLLAWRRSLGALRDMVEARRDRFAQVAPRVEQRLAIWRS
jgi:tetratricopeptide (TPR) repeat protein